ncbi:uncharacterized protein LOC129779436 [Toxorhynchites rutilus septentrionalis]|uniref:uncharacterized protein LOC129779436 n=1 Tax=Toxorhynchites rutilus septentrionalis TaxID=329112 RepID=UPI00247A563B|nr:uncharacterized protein LOC129779436 [Toxorhynchites rutilus septentrionalis]XP_055642890.1 uncharacterized protein LOC129779436 [Toxorhynchites rutilus septentrionalis]
MAKIRNVFKKHLIPNLESKCRLCLSDKEIVQSIFRCETKETTDTLVEKIFECTAIMLSKDFDFPSPICEDCALKLDEFLLFRAKCLRSNEIYRFNKLHKPRLLNGGAKPDATGDGRDGKKDPEPPDHKDDPKEDQGDRDVIATSSSSDGANVTVINYELPSTDSVQQQQVIDETKITECNGKSEDIVETDGRKSTDLWLIDSTEATTMSEPLRTVECSEHERSLKDVIEGIVFPIGTVKELDHLEHCIRTCPLAREKFITLLRSLKTHDTSLSDTYQRLFTDVLMIHYNYDGISPKYNKRPLKSLSIFTECMLAAWNDHMDANSVREAIIEAVKKSHNRYNQCNHRKRSRQVYL